jgi:hypothetical protein
MIVVDFGADVQEYAELGKEQNCSVPGGCPHCRAVKQIIGHGYYQRKPKGLGVGYVMRVKRWRCKACGKTFGSLPSFVLSFRHYLVEVIQFVLEGRLEKGYSWAATEELCSEEGMPALRTMQRWCRAFEGYAPEWLREVDRTLAEQDSLSPWLDATQPGQGQLLSMVTGGKALLQVSMYLLAWGKTRWQEMAAYGLKDRLRFLWHWGANQGLPRLA